MAGIPVMPGATETFSVVSDSPSVLYAQNSPNYKVRIGGQLIPYNHQSMMHRNIVMSETLQAIESVVLFSTTNKLTIFLQRNGFSRETALFIRKHRSEYVVGLDDSRPVKIKKRHPQLR